MRLSGVNIADERQVWIGLTDIYGVGQSTSRQILRKLNIEDQRKMKDLTDSEVEKIRESLEKITIEGDLRTAVLADIKHQQNVHSYRGTRHLHKLPVRGQRTKTNARTKRGKRVTVGSGRKPTAQKT